MLLLVYCIAEGPTASEALALERALIQAALDLLSELRGVVFCKAFHEALEDNPLRAFRYGFRGIEYLNAVSPELPLIDRAVIFVPRKAVCLVDDNSLELMGLSVCNESLKLWALVCSPRDMSVAVGVNYGQAPLLTELCADSDRSVSGRQNSVRRLLYSCTFCLPLKNYVVMVLQKLSTWRKWGG